MAKWAVILTAIALCFLGVLSQTPSNVQNISPEESNSSVSSLLANFTSAIPPASTSVKDPPAFVKDDDPTETSVKENLSQIPGITETSTFPPLVHNEHPETSPTTATTPTTPVTTTPTTKAPEIKEAITEMSQSPTTHKPNSSNRLHLSSIALLSSVLLLKFHY
ncbi:hypothetical protein QE152_g32080 [Popillia japonica]|uniref:Uncharacterized protein n=1 Tax=Popillia japonica TaxID=7064 RepID=A0AAW1J099_POPJA